MPRAKRPLSEADPNANKNAQPKAKAPKRLQTYERTEKKHPNVTVSIAETVPLQKSHDEARKDLPRPPGQRAGELLSERGLPKTGRKDVLVERLEEHDKQHPSTEKKIGDDHKEALRRRPVPIGAVASEMGPKEEDTATRLLRAGRNGPPVYDEMGFELDYDKVGGGGRPSKQAMLNRMDRAVARAERKGAVKARVMGMEEEKVSFDVERAWDDRVSRDLGIPFHKVGAEQFEEWEKKGFKANPRDFENLGKEEEERLDFLQAGCALRK